MSGRAGRIVGAETAASRWARGEGDGPLRPDPALPHACGPAIAARDECLRAMGRGLEIFERIDDGVEVRGHRRSPDLVAARTILYWLMRQRGLSFPEIGAACGVNHSTVITAMQRLRLRAEAWEEPRRDGPPETGDEGASPGSGGTP